jgi:DNA-binding CsgD family transcriptional regulator
VACSRSASSAILAFSPASIRRLVFVVIVRSVYQTKRPFSNLTTGPKNGVHFIGRNGFSIPLRNRRGVVALVSFTSDLADHDWEIYKTSNMRGLRLLSVLIDSAANINFKLPPVPVQLSIREEQCLLWAARGKTYQEIAEILGLAFGSVKTHLDGARHKLRCMNLTHAAAVAFATGVIPAQALK